MYIVYITTRKYIYSTCHIQFKRTLQYLDLDLGLQSSFHPPSYQDVTTELSLFQLMWISLRIGNDKIYTSFRKYFLSMV